MTIMLTSDFDYELPPKLIAQTPATPRDSSRLMVVDKDTQKIEHKHFYDIVNYLGAGDLLVWNNTKVFKARLRGTPMHDTESDGVEEKIKSSGKILNSSPVEIFLVRPMENKFVWKALAKPGRRLRLGMKVQFAKDFVGEVMLKENDGTILMQFAEDDVAVRAKANRYGTVPTPPYIKNTPSQGGSRGVLVNNLRNKEIKKQRNIALESVYQTVYAKHEGSVAAPTAGFHFTPELIEKLEKKGVQFAEVTLHVGLGTFLPVKSECVEDHKMHSEWVEITAKNADLINAAKQEGRRVVAVGTTTVRTLEGVARLCHSDRASQRAEESLDPCVAKAKGSLDFASPARRGGLSSDRDDSEVKPYCGDINLFITPGFKFQIVDALITNFHLPKSTLLMLVSAFADGAATADKSTLADDGLAGRSPASSVGRLGEGRQFVLQCYQEAVRQNYRFYSFGDAMLIK